MIIKRIINSRQVFLIILVLFLSVPESEGAGVVLMREGEHLYHENVPSDAGHMYYGTLEGPGWENMYCQWRIYIDADDRNASDITGKREYDSTLSTFDEPGASVHSDNGWGTDILSVGSNLGIGTFRLVVDGEWVNAELPENLDSMVIDLVDTTIETPAFTISYYGWDLGAVTVDAVWTVSTVWENRAVNCELDIKGDFDGMVVTGVVKHDNVDVTLDETACLLATLGEQTILGDSLLMAVRTEPEYFVEFTEHGGNLCMNLQPDGDGHVEWSFASSWVQEPQPAFREADWQSVLFPVTEIGGQPFRPYTNEEKAGQRLNIQNGRLVIPESAGCTSVEIFAPDGRMVFDKKTTPGKRSVVSLDGFNSGIYIMRAAVNGNIKTRKLRMFR